MSHSILCQLDYYISQGGRISDVFHEIFYFVFDFHHESIEILIEQFVVFV